MFLKHLWPALSGALLVLILSVLPQQDFPEVGMINADKVVHVLMYGGLTYLFAKGFYRQTACELLNRHYLITAAVLCTLYGGFLEILQSAPFISRSGDWLDFFFNGIGALASAAVLKMKKELLMR